MLRFKTKIRVFYYLVLLAIMCPVVVWGQTVPPGGDTVPPGDTSFSINIPNPLQGISSLQEFVKAILDNIVLPIGSVVVVMAIIYAGFKFVTAQGKPEEINKAKQAFLWVLIGSAILLGSWLIANAIKGTVDQLLVLI